MLNINFSTYIPMDRRVAIGSQQQMPDRMEGAVLFADISGFTPLTEALASELGPKRGAEELTRHLNIVYTALITHVHKFGGSVIGFAGDAITCWFEDDIGVRAASAGLGMQESMKQFHQMETPAGKPISLAIKTAVTTGPIRRFLVGDPDIQLIDVLAGATLTEMAKAEMMAEKGELILGPGALASMKDRALIQEFRRDEEGAIYAVASALKRELRSWPWSANADQAIGINEAELWTLPPIFDRIKTGQANYLAELRPTVPFFLSFTGLNYDDDNDAGVKLNHYLTWVQRTLKKYEGYMFQFIVGDKGNYLYGAFGAPTSHEDDTERAIAATLDLRQTPAEFDYIKDVKIGVSQGRAWTGAYGADTRNTYGLLGDEINTAARLMGAAKPGQILVSDHVVQKAGKLFLFNSLGAIPLKGKKEPMAIAEAIGRQTAATQRSTTLYPHPLVGRDSEMVAILDSLESTIAGNGQIFRLSGETGIGKSHLAAEFSKRAQQQGFRLINSASQSTTRSTPYYIWQQLLNGLLDLNQPDPVEHLENLLTHLNPDWLLLMPLLGDILNVQIAENSTTAVFDPMLRQEALFALVTNIIQTISESEPLLLLIEDGHWLDERSIALTEAVATAISRFPIMILIVQRPIKELLESLAYLPNHHSLLLQELSPTGIEQLVIHRLGQPLRPLALALIQTKAHGHPFFTEQLTTTLQESGKLVLSKNQLWELTDDVVLALKQASCLQMIEDELHLLKDAPLTAVDLGIPDSIHGLVLSRIDRLTENEKLTLKVASVIGQTFNLDTLRAIHPLKPEFQTLLAQMEVMEEREFVIPQQTETGQIFLFKHNTTETVAYETLLYAQRRSLHQAIAEWYEQRFDDQAENPLESILAPYFPMLVHHYFKAENPQKEWYFARYAGEQAAAQYANEDALRYLSRAIELTAVEDIDTRLQLLLMREMIYDRRGEREAQAADLLQLDEATQLRPDYQGEVALRRTSYGVVTNQYEAAETAVAHVIKLGKHSGDHKLETEGYVKSGHIAWMQGKFDDAKIVLNEALHLTRIHNHSQLKAEVLLYLGHIERYLGHLSEAENYYQQSLLLRREGRFQQAEAGCLAMLATIEGARGNYRQAREYSEKALETCQTIGYRRGQTIILQNLAIDYTDLGEYETARTYMEKALNVSRQIGNRWGEAMGLDTLGLIHFGLGNYQTAKDYYEEALHIQDDIGDKNSLGYTLTHLGQLLIEQDVVTEAVERFSRAVAIRTELGQEGPIIDSQAGLALLHLKMGEIEKATAMAKQLLADIETHGVSSLEYPIQAFLTIFQILSKDPAAATLAATTLVQAYDTMEERVKNIQDESLRQSYLNIPANKELQSLWLKAQTGQ